MRGISRLLLVLSSITSAHDLQPTLVLQPRLSHKPIPALQPIPTLQPMSAHHPTLTKQSTISYNQPITRGKSTSSHPRNIVHSSPSSHHHNMSDNFTSSLLTKPFQQTIPTHQPTQDHQPTFLHHLNQARQPISDPHTSYLPSQTPPSLPPPSPPSLPPSSPPSLPTPPSLPPSSPPSPPPGSALHNTTSIAHPSLGPSPPLPTSVSQPSPAPSPPSAPQPSLAPSPPLPTSVPQPSPPTAPSLATSERQFSTIPQDTTGIITAGSSDSPQRMWDPSRVLVLGRGAVGGALENVTVTRQSVQLGDTTYLHCLAPGGEEKQVTWVRRRDYHILTSGLQTYTHDQRFSVARDYHHGGGDDGGEDWPLQIRSVKARDEGEYECQVWTRGGGRGAVVVLAVVVPRAVISGSMERYVQAGSMLTLTCIVHQSLTPPRFVLWYHDGNVIDYQQPRAGVTLTRDPQAEQKEGKQEKEENTRSRGEEKGERQGMARFRLNITNAGPRDSGNYTCTANNVTPASVSVFVAHGSGDKTAAIQRLGSGAERSTRCPFLLLASLCLLSRHI